MPNLYKRLDHELVLALRRGRDAEIHAMIAHYAQAEGDKSYHIRQALDYADELTTAAEALRAEMARLEDDDDEPSEVDQGLIPIPDKYAEA